MIDFPIWVSATHDRDGDEIEVGLDVKVLADILAICAHHLEEEGPLGEAANRLVRLFSTV